MAFVRKSGMYKSSDKRGFAFLQYRRKMQYKGLTISSSKEEDSRVLFGGRYVFFGRETLVP
jgi:hypothetical protein